MKRKVTITHITETEVNALQQPLHLCNGQTWEQGVAWLHEAVTE